MQDETALIDRLWLEMFQAGLSWELVLKRRASMRAPLDGFAVDCVAAYEAARLADARVGSAVQTGLSLHRGRDHG